MNIFQELRIRVVIALRKMGLIPLFQWVSLEISRKKRKKFFQPKPIPEDAHVLIITAYYEHPLWVRDMIASVQAQSYASWTLIIMDDCSPQSPLEEAVKDMGLGSNILLLKSQINQGAYACRNQAISNATDRKIQWTHVTFIDPDDVAYVDWLEHALECIGANEGVVRVILERWDKRLKSMNRRALSHAQSMWTRNVWEQLGGFTNVRVAADTELLLRAEYAKPPVNNFKGVQPAQKCRIHAGNASRTSLIERKKWFLKQDSKFRSSKSTL